MSRRHELDDAPPPRAAARFGVPQALVLGLVAATVGWAAWLVRDRPTTEEVELLPGTVLPSSELAIVEAAFDRAQLAGHRTEEGRVWVPRPRQSAYMRALVDSEALPREFGSSLRRAVEQNSPWQSRAAHEESLRIAVQEELAHVICSMPGIERAAVLYDVADRAGFGGAGPLRTASVNIRTQPDADLEPARVQAIRVLVAASIAGLDPVNVAVTDLRSGRVHAGPLVESDQAAEAAVDPALARRIAHERHLAAKVRQAVAFVKGAVVDVTVTFPPDVPAAAAVTSAAVPEPAPHHDDPLLPRRQRVAEANAPAEIGINAEPPPAAPVAAAPPPRHDGPDTILVALAVPEAYFTAASRAALEADPAADPAAIERLEEERLATHVRMLLPPTPRDNDRRVVVSRFPSAGVVRSRPVAAAASAPVAAAQPREPVGASSQPAAGDLGRMLERAAAIVADTRDAIQRGEPAAVPREAWLVVIVAAGAALVGVVLRGQVSPAARVTVPRRQPRIDWSALDDEHDAPRSRGRDDDASPRMAA